MKENQLLSTVSIFDEEKQSFTGYYQQYSQKRVKLCLLYFCFSHLYLSLAGNIIVHRPSQGTNKEKY